MNKVCDFIFIRYFYSNIFFQKTTKSFIFFNLFFFGFFIILESRIKKEESINGKIINFLGPSIKDYFKNVFFFHRREKNRFYFFLVYLIAIFILLSINKGVGVFKFIMNNKKTSLGFIIGILIYFLLFVNPVYFIFDMKKRLDKLKANKASKANKEDEAAKANEASKANEKKEAAKANEAGKGDEASKEDKASKASKANEAGKGDEVNKEDEARKEDEAAKANEASKKTHNYNVELLESKNNPKVVSKMIEEKENFIARKNSSEKDLGEENTFVPPQKKKVKDSNKIKAEIDFRKRKESFEEKSETFNKKVAVEVNAEDKVLKKKSDCFYHDDFSIDYRKKSQMIFEENLIKPKRLNRKKSFSDLEEKNSIGNSNIFPESKIINESSSKIINESSSKIINESFFIIKKPEKKINNNLAIGNVLKTPIPNNKEDVFFSSSIVSSDPYEIYKSCLGDGLKKEITNETELFCLSDGLNKEITKDPELAYNFPAQKVNSKLDIPPIETYERKEEYEKSLENKNLEESHKFIAENMVKNMMKNIVKNIEEQRKEEKIYYSFEVNPKVEKEKIDDSFEEKLDIFEGINLDLIYKKNEEEKDSSHFLAEEKKESNEESENLENTEKKEFTKNPKEPDFLVSFGVPEKNKNNLENSFSDSVKSDGNSEEKHKDSNNEEISNENSNNKEMSYENSNNEERSDENLNNKEENDKNLQEKKSENSVKSNEEELSLDANEKALENKLLPKRSEAEERGASKSSPKKSGSGQKFRRLSLIEQAVFLKMK